MRICFVSRGSLNSFWDTYGGSDADIVFFGFQGIGEVSYEKELRGETGYFEDAAILSKENHNVVVCGCVTDTRGVKRKSAVVAENGRLLGVSDMLNAIDGEYKSGAGYSQLADVSGAVAFASPDSPVEFSLDKKQEYHLIETRRRGFYKAPKKDF